MRLSYGEGTHQMRFSIGIAFAAGFAATSFAGPAGAADKIKVGFFSTLEGPYTALGEDGQRGFDLAVMQHSGKAGGKDLEIIRGSSDASPDSALRAAKKLVEQDKVDILIAPLSGSEGIALRDYAKTQPQVTIINGCSGALETTYVTPAPNYFRFNIDGAQMQKGLGEYIYNVKHYKKIATVGEDYSFIYTQVFGLALDYCPLGGQITKRIWVPLGTKDFGSVISSLPDDVDAIYLGLGGADALNFLNQYQQAGGNAKLIGGSIMVDQTVLSSKGKAKDALLGTVSAGPQADSWDDPNWQALDKVNGDLSDGHKKFREALTSLVLEAPNGQVKLDSNRQAIGTSFVTEAVKDANGDLVSKVVQVVPNVNQTLGIDPAAFAKIGLPGREVPVCKKSYD